MKEAILRLLKKNCGTYVSGEEICKNLQVTRTAVWKHIQTLREDDYEIEARPRAGYQLTGIPDRLYPEEIRDGLSTRIMGQNKIFYFPTLSSTNEQAREEAISGAFYTSFSLYNQQPNVNPENNNGLRYWQALLAGQGACQAVPAHTFC